MRDIALKCQMHSWIYSHTSDSFDELISFPHIISLNFI